MKNKAYTYWIHLKEHTDPHQEGYVGVSKNVSRRIREHKSKKENPILVNVFNKYDVEIDILFIGEYEYCFEVENQYRPKKQIGWNINEGGIRPPNVSGIKRSEKTKKLMSENNVGFKNKTHSEESKKRMSDTHKKIGGRPQSEETKKKLSEIAKNRKFNPMKGRKHTEETRKLISMKLRNHTHNTQGEKHE